jgi:hypothetical protein
MRRGENFTMKKWARIVGILVVLGVLGYLLYGQVLKRHEQAIEESQEQKREAWQRENERLEREINELKEELALKQEATLPEKKLLEIFGEDGAGPVGVQGESEREEVDRKVKDFFAYLDDKDYIKAYGLEKGTLESFQGMADRLAKNPPVVSAEMKDPFLLVRNVAHFYRVLGKRDLRLARDVIENESEIAEPVGAIFFEWALPEDPSEVGIEGRPSLSTLYEYAGFFLDSMGGRSYLLRRDSRIRILTTYYCVLIVDRANQEEANRHGIDIRPHIDSVAEEIRNQRGLVFQKDYLDTLAGLQEKYAAR